MEIALIITVGLLFTLVMLRLDALSTFGRLVGDESAVAGFVV